MLICRGGEPRPGYASPSGPTVGGCGGRLGTRLIARHQAGSCIAFHLRYRFRRRVLRRRQKEAADAAVQPTPTPKPEPSPSLSPQDCGETSARPTVFSAPPCSEAATPTVLVPRCALLSGYSRTNLPPCADPMRLLVTRPMRVLGTSGSQQAGDRPVATPYTHQAIQGHFLGRCRGGLLWHSASSPGLGASGSTPRVPF